MSGAPAQVPDQVLRWLYNSLAGNYHEVDRTYSDVAQALSTYPSISPRTDIYTYENGASQLLLLLQGTIPVQFRGTTYRYPIAVWVPHTYPRESPMAFVKPTADMAVRPGQHVSIEGRIYHPYLANWAAHWMHSSVADLIGILRDVFSKEPPVVARRQEAQNNQTPRSPPPPPVLPPKPGDPPHSAVASPVPAGGPLQRGPPLPPAPPLKPGQRPVAPQPIRSPPAVSSPARDPRQGPPAPPLPWQQQQHQQPPYPGAAGPGTPQQMSLPIRGQHSSGAPAPFAPGMQPGNVPLGQPQQPGPNQHPSRAPQPASLPPGPEVPPPGQYPRGHGAAWQHPAPVKKPIEDLMNSPLQVTLPSQNATAVPIPAPPIPRNPEKDALLQAAGASIRGQIEQIISQNAVAVPALEAQQVALQDAHHRMQAELYQLEELDKMLVSNEKILHDSMREADRVVEAVSRREVPSVDEVLVAPTVVGEQLYNLVAEERSIADALFLLTRALDKGRISGDVFVKQTRSLAREQFVKKALIRKIAQGMGLSMPPSA